MDETTFDKQIQKIRELQKETERLELEAQELMNALGVTPEEIEHLFSNPAHFTEEEKKFLEKQETEFHFKLKERTENVRTTDGLKKKYEDLHVSRHWIPVR